MASYNYIILIGNLTKDIEISYTPSQVAVGSFGIAVNKKFTSASGEKKESVLFIDCVVFKEQAVTLSKYVKKGSPLMVTGELQLDTWQDKQGNNRSKHKILVNSFQFLSSGEKKESQPNTEAEDSIPF